ncbi:MAG: hypothetical protein IIV43_05570, partial [Oscillospiraceae bacterium]|nr:hypothetical protein [Oscillospiraceae bacterium]
LAMYPVYTGVGNMSSNGPFYTRCLESMLDVGVDVFSTTSIGWLREGYQIVGFRTGVPKTDYGWAVFRVQNNAATFTGQMQRFENAADINNGILISSTPALTNETGEITDKDAFDVILIANPDIASMQIHTDPPMDLGTQEISVPDMVTIPWDTTKDAKSVAFYFFDAEGNLVPDGEGLEAQLQTESPSFAYTPVHIGYMTDIAEAYLADPIEAAKQKLPAGIIQIDRFRGEHDMVQFACRSSLTNQYRGYYYSPDDVPLPFQNADIPLLETADGWTWEDGTGNHGTTERIAECWFRYTANF